MNALFLGLALGALPCIDRYAYCPRVHVDDCSDDYLATRCCRACADARQQVIASFSVHTTEEIHGKLVVTPHPVILRAGDDAHAVAVDVCKRSSEPAVEGNVARCVTEMMTTLEGFHQAARAAFESKWRTATYDDSAVGKLQAFIDDSLDGNWTSAEPWAWTDRSGRQWGVGNGVVWNSTLRVVMYGSSHLRELGNAWVRDTWQMGALDELPKHITHVPSRAPNASEGCLKFNPNAGFMGLDTVDLVQCGPPGYRVVRELSATVALGMKGYLHTPIADSLFLERLERDGLRHPEVLVVDVGVWGPRGYMGLDEGVYTTALNMVDEVHYFVKWVRSHFARSVVVWVFGYCGAVLRRESCLSVQAMFVGFVQQHPRRSSELLVDKSRVAGLGYGEGFDVDDSGVRPQGMPCEHGCQGPALRVLSRLLQEAIARLPTQGAF
jgi:hypothetical protein